jgi:dTDP-4-amino-4,6-dideoxygalactose transaminase
MGACPESEKASREVISLPLHTRADEKTAERTVDFVTRYTQVLL